MTEETQTQTQEQEAPKPQRKHKVPQGWITPVEATHMLVDGGLAKSTLNSAQLYILSRNATSNGMPVAHFDREGKRYEERQVDPVTGQATTRPALHWDGIEGEDGIGSFKDWWVNRPKRQPGQQKPATPEAQAQDIVDESVEEAEAEELGGDEELQEAE